LTATAAAAPAGPARRRLRDEILNLPNLITIGRVLMIPAVLLLLYFESPLNSFFAAVVFGLASATDALDGYLARKTGQTSTFGKFLDPLADKLIVMASLVMMLPMGRVPAWMVIVLLARELTVTALRSIATTEGLVIAASREGKYKTALQLIGIVALILHHEYPLWLFGLGEIRVSFHVVGLWLLVLSLVFSVFSAGDYLARFLAAAARGTRRSGPPA
jgi:CDP-diacylglycerol--glycerol-3-phosphate 3-phosphatidyltransferase